MATKMHRKLPNLHKQALVLKNKKRLQHDGGRAWSRDGQLHDSCKGANFTLKTCHPQNLLEDAGRQVLEKKAGEYKAGTDTGRKL